MYSSADTTEILAFFNHVKVHETAGSAKLPDHPFSDLRTGGAWGKEGGV